MSLPSLALLPALLLAQADAPTGARLYKCVAPTGAVSYQSLPCAQGSTQAWVQPVKAEPLPPPASPPPRRETSPARARREAGPAAPRRPGARELRRQRCDKARREADALRDRLWNRLDFQARSDLDAKVARACAR